MGRRSTNTRDRLTPPLLDRAALPVVPTGCPNHTICARDGVRVTRLQILGHCCLNYAVCGSGPPRSIGASCRTAETACVRTRAGALGETVHGRLVATSGTGRDHTAANSEVVHDCSWQPWTAAA